MNREKLCVIVLIKDGKSEYYVGTSFEAGYTSLHCGPYSTEEMAWSFIDDITETEII